MRRPPLRAPHHTVSHAGLVGGGQWPKPGEISLSHRGVLFLDELPEFGHSVLEVLRQPLEDGNVTIARAAATVTFPCQFMLVAAMNPCPCGNANHNGHDCRCTRPQIDRYVGNSPVNGTDRLGLSEVLEDAVFMTERGAVIGALASENNLRRNNRNVYGR